METEAPVTGNLIHKRPGTERLSAFRTLRHDDAAAHTSEDMLRAIFAPIYRPDRLHPVGTIGTEIAKLLVLHQRPGW